jgi:hypothetical protein
MIALRSNWIGKKLYYKGQEFLDVERKKHRHIYNDQYMAGERDCNNPHEMIPLSANEINDLMSMLRFELEFKRAFLKRYDMQKIKLLPRLVERFEIEKEKYINIPVLSRGDLGGAYALSPQENQIIDCIRRFGLFDAKNQFINKYSERSWYRNKRSLSARGIHIEALDNLEHRFTGLEIFHNPQHLNFQFELASFSEPYLQAA